MSDRDSYYGEAQLWDLAADLIDKHGADMVTRDLIRSAESDLADTQVDFVFEIAQGEL